MANRNDYLKSLNNMRRNYQTSGNALVNPSDDSTNVGEELSSFAYANTESARPEEPTDKDKGNILTRSYDTLKSTYSSLQRGLLESFDSVADFAINFVAGVGSFFGADTEWAKTATQYNWVDRALELQELTTRYSDNIFNGKLFSGEYAQAWDNFVNSKGNDFNGVLVDSQNDSSYLSDMGDVGTTATNVLEGIGGLLPSLAVAEFTGGARLGARMAVQAGLSGAEAYGSGVEKAYKEGAEFGEAQAYGAVKGTISAGTTAVLMGLGGYASSKGGEGIIGSASSKVGDGIFKLTKSHGAQAFATAVSEAVGRAGTTFATSMANQAVEPYIQSIYDDGKAIQEAYGSNERISQYIQRCTVNASTSAIVTGLVTLGREGAELATRGRNGYMAKFAYEKAVRAEQKVSNGLKSIYKDLQNGKITTDKQVEMRLSALDKYNSTVEEYGRLSSIYLYKASATESSNGITTSYNFGSNEDTVKKLIELGHTKSQTDLLMKTARNAMHSSTNSKGETYIQIGNDSFVKATPKGGELVLTSNGSSNIVKFSENNGSYTVKASDFIVPKCSSENVDTSKPIVLTNEAMKPESTKALSAIIDKGDSSKAYVLESESGRNYKAIIPTEDGKLGVIKLDAKTNEIKGAEIKLNVSETGYNIVPREDVEKIKTTKAVSKSDGQPIYVSDKALESDKFSKGSYGRVIYGHNDYSKKGSYIYSKNPFYADDYKEALSFDKVSKEFGIKDNIKDTYEYKLSKGFDKVSDFISDLTGLKIDEITERLGYDVYIDEKSGTLVTRDATSIIKGGIIDGKENGREGNVRSFGRDSRDDSIKGLKEYIGENGKEISGVQQRLDYSQKIKDAGLYETKKIGKREVSVIDEKYLTKEMRSMVDFGKKHGVNVNYAVDYKGEDNALGVYNSDTDDIIVFVDYLKNVSISELTNHEFCHYVFDKFVAEYVLNLKKQLFAIGKNSFTIQRLIDKYRTIYKDLPFADPLEELICQIYSKGESLPSRFSKYQNDVINKVNGLLSRDREELSAEYYGKLAKETDFSIEDFFDDDDLFDGLEEIELSDEDYDLISKIDQDILKDMSREDRIQRIEDDKRWKRKSYEMLSPYEKRYLSFKKSYERDYDKLVKVLNLKMSDNAKQYFKDSKVRNDKGELIPMFHGTPSKDMFYFDTKRIGTFGGSKRGSGLYLNSNLHYSEEYTDGGNGKVIMSFVNITNPISDQAQTIEKGKIADFVSKHMLEDLGISENEVDSFVENKILNRSSSDWDTFQNLYNSVKGEMTFDEFAGNFTDTFGMDGYIAWKRAEGDVAVAFRSNQIKDITNEKPTENEDIRYSMEDNSGNDNKPVEVKDDDRQKIISDLQAKSSNVLIKAGADVKKGSAYRIEAIKQALPKVIQSVLDKDAKIKLIPSETKQTFAELNLAKPKDRFTAVENAVKGALSSKVELDGKSYVLRDLLTAEQEEDLRVLVNENLKGIAEKSKYSKWAESLNLSKLENKENIHNAKLLGSITKKIDASLKNTYGYGDVATGDLTLYKNIISDVKPFFDNDSIVKLADNVLANYTDKNLEKMYDAFGIDKNPLIPHLANLIKDNVVEGKHLDPKISQLGNSILQLIKNDLNLVAQGSHDAKVKTAKSNINVAQGLFYNKKDHTKNKFVGGITNALGKLDASIVSPSMFIHSIMPDSPIDNHFSYVMSEYENRVIEKENEIMDYLFKETNGGKDITKELNKKIEFKGEKVTYAYALKQLNVERTLGDKYYEVKGAITNADGTRGEVKYTKEDIDELRKSLPQEILDWNEKFVKDGLNGKLGDFIKEQYKAITKTELPLLDNGRDWVHISRVTDKALPTKGFGRGNSIDLSVYSKRVDSVADLNLDGDLVTDTVNYVKDSVRKLIMYDWVEQTNIMFNQRVYGTTLNAIMQKNIVGWDEIVDLTYHQVLGLPYENTNTLLSKVASGFSQVAKATVSGLQTATRTISSAPWFANYFGAKIALAGGMLDVTHGGVVNAFVRNSKIVKEYSPYLKQRLEGNEVISAETSAKFSSQLSKALGTPMRITDGYIVVSGYGFSCAQAKAMEEGYGDPYTDSNNKRAVKILEEAVKKSQPTNSVLNVGGFRYGQYGQVTKLTFGMFSSQTQAFYSGLRNTAIDLTTSKKKIDSLEDSIQHEKEREDFYAEEEKKHIKEMDEAETDEEFKKAQKKVEKDRWKQEEHKQTRESQEDYLKGFKENHTGKKQFNKLIGSVSGLIVSAMSYVMIDRLIKVAEGKKDIDDYWDGITETTAEQALFRSIPYISTLYHSIKNDSDLSAFTLDNLNSVIGACKGIADAINSRDGGNITGATLNAIKEASMFFGLPTKSIWKLVNGIWHNIDKESNITANNWLGYLSANKLRQNYQDAVKEGKESTAKANLEVWSYGYSVKTSKAVIDEIYRLNKGGYTGVTPTGISKTYTDDKGEKRSYTSAQIDSFKQAYSKADREMLSLVKSNAYQSLDDEYKAKAVSSLYSYYNEYAKSKRDGTQASSKIGVLLEQTGGDVGLAKYIAGLKQIVNITESKRNSRKENVIKAINKMTGFSKGERLLLAYLGGYGVSESSSRSLVNQLVSLGFTRKSALSYIS